MIRTTRYCFVVVLLWVIARVNSLICTGMSQYDQCSTNSACGCLHMPGAGASVGICGFLGVTCSELVACQAPYDTCYEPDHICVYHPRCSDIPVCYPMLMMDQNICPSMTVATTRTTSTTTTTTTTNGNIIIPNIPFNAMWAPQGITVAGGRGNGSVYNQLYYPHGLRVDEDQTVFIADFWNHRIVEWRRGSTSGRVVAGGNGQGSQIHQLNKPTDVIVDKRTNSLIICDRDNRRVMQWSRQIGTTTGQMIIDNIDCWGLSLNAEIFLYVSDYVKHAVLRYRLGVNAVPVTVAGGNGNGIAPNQLKFPTYIFVDREYSVYVSDNNNHRVMKWGNGARQGIVVAGGQGQGNQLKQLSHPAGVFVDSLGSVYVADEYNHRVMRWRLGQPLGTVVVGGIGNGQAANQLNQPMGLSFDLQGNLYVTDLLNSRVQRFSIIPS